MFTAETLQVLRALKRNNNAQVEPRGNNGRPGDQESFLKKQEGS